MSAQTKIFRDQQGKRVRFKDGGRMALPVIADTTAANLSDFGVSTFGSTAGKTYDMDAPSIAGLQKWLVCTQASTDAVQSVRVSTGGAVLLNASTDAKSINFDAPGRVFMVSRSAAVWDAIPSSAAVTFTT